MSYAADGHCASIEISYRIGIYNLSEHGLVQS